MIRLNNIVILNKHNEVLCRWHTNGSLRCTNLSGQSKLLKFGNNDWKEFQKDTPQV